MYLHKLELHGFKSFADRTEIHFAPGITAIVGPNGCGKSNIIDAVRWVLGEQRARMLRSEKMDNVIFNGTGKRKQLGLSEVSLTIENTRNVLPTEYTDVTVTRRLYRSGESEYLLNKTPCRLKDIIDLFMDTGMGAHAYSVIELKMTDDILSENTQDRRGLFEEAAGITRYKFRRTQALRKLKNTQTDLLRVRDLVEELEKRVRSLSRQASKAGRHKKISTRLNELEIQVAKLEYGELTDERITLEGERDTLRKHIEEQTAKQSAEEASQEEMRTRLVSLEHDLSERQRRLNAHVERVRTLESDLRLEKQRAESSARNLERTETEKQASERRRNQLQQDLDRLTEEADKARPAVDQATALRTKANETRERAQETLDATREALDVVRLEQSEANERLSSARNELYRLQNRGELLQSRKTEAENRGRGAESSIRKLKSELAQLDQTVGLAEKALNETQDLIATAQQQYDALGRRQEVAREERHRMERRFSALAAEIEVLEGLVASYDDVSESVAFLASEKSWAQSTPLTVADIVACDPADRAAIEALLGDFASCFVVDSDAEAAAGIRALRESEKGRAAFFVLDRVPATQSKQESSVGRSAAGVIRLVDEKYRSLLNLLLQEAYVVDSLETAFKAARSAGKSTPSVRFATLDGEWVEGTGRVHGGSKQAAGSAGVARIGRRERLERLRGEQTELSLNIEQSEKEIDRIVAEQTKLETDRLQKDLQEREQRFNDARTKSRQLTYRIELEEKSRKGFVDDLEAARQQLAEVSDKQTEARSRLESEEEQLSEQKDKTAASEEQFREADRAAHLATSQYNDANLAAVKAENALGALIKDGVRVKDELQELAKRETRRATEAEQYRLEKDKALKRRTELDAKITQGYTEKAGFDEAVNQAEAAVNELKGRLSQQESVLRDIRRLREEAQRQESIRTARLAEIGVKLEDLVEHTIEDHDISLVTDEIVLPDDFDPEAARQELPDLRQRLRNLGAVNELALESYEEEKERLDFMSVQLVDLENAENTLMETIKEINTEASRRFEETFEEIQRHFKKLFTDLFGEGATANIVLTGEEDPLESPVEIMAYPKGKKPSTISQLSGGEKTLTAIALLFAIYLVKPSPFCILDEVDAPLDDANVRRFMNMIRSFSAETQFILVTHNKLTMEAADRMYGVTMPEQGVSKLVGVRFDELELQKEPVEAA